MPGKEYFNYMLLFRRDIVHDTCKEMWEICYFKRNEQLKRIIVADGFLCEGNNIATETGERACGSKVQ